MVIYLKAVAKFTINQIFAAVSLVAILQKSSQEVAIALLSALDGTK